jgi:cation diffusion facilitator CzcD-associated flavoprotein CzcO
VCGRLPGADEADRSDRALGRAHLRRQVHDRELRAKLMPRFRFGGRRSILSNIYYPVLSGGNVDVVTEGIQRVDGGAIVCGTASGMRSTRSSPRSATAAAARCSSNRVVGRGARKLGETWNQSPRAYLGTTVPGRSNTFILLGPNAIGINSLIFSLESQIAKVMDALRTMERRAITRIEPQPEVLADHVAEFDRRGTGSIWADVGGKACYTDHEGRNGAIYPGFASWYRWRTRRFDVAAYAVATAERDEKAGAA